MTCEALTFRTLGIRIQLVGNHVIGRRDDLRGLRRGSFPRRARTKRTPILQRAFCTGWRRHTLVGHMRCKEPTLVLFTGRTHAFLVAQLKIVVAIVGRDLFVALNRTNAPDRQLVP